MYYLNGVVLKFISIVYTFEIFLDNFFPLSFRIPNQVEHKLSAPACR